MLNIFNKQKNEIIIDTNILKNNKYNLYIYI